MSIKITSGAIRLKRAYEPAEPGDGTLILVDRLWPRGVKKADAAIDRWLKDIAPSTALRQWFAHRPERWPEFRRRYRAELRQRPELVEQIRNTAREGPVTLVYAARDEAHNDAVVLRDVLGNKAIRRRRRRLSTALLCSIALLLSPHPGSAAEIDASSFRCLTKMTPVRQFFVDNLRGDLAGTVAAAKSAPGSIYPPGSLLQLIPGEAMVKRDSGFNAQTKDWEFFSLAPSKDGTRIQARGTLDVANPFGTCLGCHAQATLQWDLVCETGHGCPPLPVKPEMIGALKRTDPRCGNPISAEDAQILKQLSEVLKAKK